MMEERAMSRCLICGLPLAEGEVTIHAQCARKIFRVGYIPDCKYTHQQLIDEALRQNPSEVGADVVSLRVAITAESESERAAFCFGENGLNYILSLSIIPDRDDIKVAATIRRMAAAARIGIAPWAITTTLDGVGILVQLDALFGRRRTLLAQRSIAEVAEVAEVTSVEQIAALVAKHTTASRLETINLFEIVYFCWLIGYSELRAADLKLVKSSDGFTSLAPLTALTSTALTAPTELDFAYLTLASKQSDISAEDLTKAMIACGITQKVIENIFTKYSALVDSWCDIIEESNLSDILSEQLKFMLFIKS